MSILFEKIEALFPLQTAFQPRKDLWVYSYRFPEVFDPDTASRSTQEIEFKAGTERGESENVSLLEVEFRLSEQNMLSFLEKMEGVTGELGGVAMRLTYFLYKLWPEGEKPFWLKDLVYSSEFMVWGGELQQHELANEGLTGSMRGKEGSFYSGILKIAFPIAAEERASGYPEPVSRKTEGEKSLVMLVDDNDATLSLLETILRTEFREEELDFIPCNSGVQAFDLALESKPDMILLDLMMPGKSGFEVLEDLKKHPDTRGIPVVILSVIYDEESLETAEKLGVDRYLVKPFVPYDISQVIREMLFGKGSGD